MRSTFIMNPASFTSNPGLTAQNDALGRMLPLFLLKSLCRLHPDSVVAVGSNVRCVASGRW